LESLARVDSFMAVDCAHAWRVAHHPNGEWWK